MKPTKRSLSRLSIVAVTFLSLIGLGVTMTGEPASKRANGKPTPEKHHVGLVEDWSTHHLVFSNPGTYEQAVAKGTYAKWLNLHYNNRFIMQQARRRADAVGASGLSDSKLPAIKLLGASGATHGRGPIRPRPVPGTTMSKDWSAPILTGSVLPNTFPAKWSFDTMSTPDCTNDFVVYPTGSTGSATRATIIAYSNLYATTCSGAVPSVYWAYNTGAGAVTTSPIISGDGTQVAFMQASGGVARLVLVKWRQTPAQHTATGNITAGSTAVTITSGGSFSAADVGLRITGSLSGIPAGDTIASVTDSTHATLANAATITRPILTLTIHTETVALPGVPPTVSAASYKSCTAPCMTTLTLSGSPNDTSSAPFYDYAVDDALYVGDNRSYLHKFTGVFGGIPTEATSVQLNATAYRVSSPVYDPDSGCVFVGDTRGFLYSVSSGAPGTVCTGSSFALYGRSKALGGAANGGIFDAPLVDSTAQRVYAFVADSIVVGSCAAGQDCVAQFTTSTITSGSTTAAPAAAQPLGTGGVNYNLYAGAFDNVYYSSSDPSSPSGNLFVLGNTNVITGTGTLYRIPISSNVMGAPASLSGGPIGTNLWGSPITEFCNNGPSACTANGTATTAGTDYIFLSVFNGTAPGCTSSTTNGCVISLNVTTPTAVSFSSALDVVLAGQASPGCWATGGLIIDNSSTSTGASEVYFVNLAGNKAPSASLCYAPAANTTIYAVQASQSGLQ